MGNIPILKVLVESTPQSVHDADRFGRSILWHAACGGSTQAIRILVQSGADVDLGNANGVVPLHIACREGHINAANTLLELNANPNIQTHELGLTPAHYAATISRFSILDLLSRFGAELNAEPKFGLAPADLFKLLESQSSKVTLQQ